MRKVHFRSECFPRSQWAFLPRTAPFPLLAGPGKMPPLLKNDSKSEPLLPEEVAVMGGGDLILPPF